MLHVRRNALVLPIAETLATATEGLVAHPVRAWRSHACGIAKAQESQGVFTRSDRDKARVNIHRSPGGDSRVSAAETSQHIHWARTENLRLE